MIGTKTNHLSGSATYFDASVKMIFNILVKISVFYSASMFNGFQRKTVSFILSQQMRNFYCNIIFYMEFELCNFICVFFI